MSLVSSLVHYPVIRLVYLLDPPGIINLIINSYYDYSYMLAPVAKTWFQQTLPIVASFGADIPSGANCMAESRAVVSTDGDS